MWAACQQTQTLTEMNVSDKYNPVRSDSASASQPAPGDVAPKGTPATGEAICPECDGTGKINGKPCENCGGSGKVVQGVGGA